VAVYGGTPISKGINTKGTNGQTAREDYREVKDKRTGHARKSKKKRTFKANPELDRRDVQGSGDDTVVERAKKRSKNAVISSETHVRTPRKVEARRKVFSSKIKKLS